MSNLVISFASCLAKMVWHISKLYEYRGPKSYMFNILEIKKNGSVRFSHCTFSFYFMLCFSLLWFSIVCPKMISIMHRRMIPYMKKLLCLSLALFCLSVVLNSHLYFIFNFQMLSKRVFVWVLVLFLPQLTFYII